MIYYRHLFKFSNKSINFDSKGFVLIDVKHLIKFLKLKLPCQFIVPTRRVKAVDAKPCFLIY